MEIFAIVEDAGSNKIIKINIDKPSQQGIETIFSNQEEVFLKDKQEIPFSATYHPSSDQIFLIEDFDDQIGVLDTIQRSTSMPEWDPKDIPLSCFKAIFSGIKGHGKIPTKVFIQTFDKKQILSNVRTFYQVPYKSHKQFGFLENPGFSISDKLTCILENKKLYFKNFNMLRRFFDMDSYFREATTQDVQSFLRHKSLYIDDESSFLGFTDTVIRKDIALIIDSKILENFSAAELKERSEKFKGINSVDFKIIDSGGLQKIVLPNDKRETKKILRLLRQGYFNSLLTDEPMMTNSMRKLT